MNGNDLEKRMIKAGAFWYALGALVFDNLQRPNA
jgi:hypothetical protein